ncbi:MAG: D-alanine--D-alanine ligase family protein, partial [Longimicrobiales bacterium]
DVIFNTCETPLGRADLEPHLAGLFEWLGVRFTGASSHTLALCRRKDRTNALLAATGVPVPRRGVFPCIVKPDDGDGSAGIDAHSICEDAQALEHARSRLCGPVIVEEFLCGREFAVSLWGHQRPQYVSIGETEFRAGLRLNTYTAKWNPDSADFRDTPMHYDIPLEPALRERIIATARAAWQVVEANGYLRIDIRLDASGVPCVLDVNPNPELGPGVGIHRAVEEAGWTWSRFVRQQVAWARRGNLLRKTLSKR